MTDPSTSRPALDADAATFNNLSLFWQIEALSQLNKFEIPLPVAQNGVQDLKDVEHQLEEQYLREIWLTKLKNTITRTHAW